MTITPAELAEIEEIRKSIGDANWVSVPGRSNGQYCSYVETDKGGEVVPVALNKNLASFIASAPATISKLVQAVRELQEAIITKDAAIKRTLAYLRTPDSIDAELIERALDRALTPNGKE